jgi:hypothetical protein
MPDVWLLSLASELRAHAEEISARAETFRDAHAREKMRQIAASYEILAQRIEQHARDIDNV